jgi:DUF4097 and DUF4098 domain-containing protein YvlB
MTQVTPPPAPVPPTPPTPPTPPARHPAVAEASWLPVVRILAVIVVAVMLLVGTVAVVSSMFTRKHTETRTFGGTVSAVEITEDVGDVRVRELSPGDPATVTATITKSFEEASWSADLRDGTLVVDGECRDDGFSFWNCSVDLTVAVPAGVPVQVSSSTGDITVAGAFSDVDAGTATGDVLVQRATGPVRIRTNTGDVRSLAMMSRVVTAETDTGDVRLIFETSPENVTTRTNTGDVTVLVPENATAYHVDAEAGTGDTTVEVANVPSSPNKIVAETDTGDVRVAYR